jgi:beta-N-acetylhexosaminidase
MGEIGEGRDPGYVADVSQVIASELQTLGFNLNFAPVLDVDTNPDNPIIGDRAFGGDPGWVGRAGGAYLYGHNVAGVVPCGKHFPGHGDTRSDSHKELPVLMHGPDRLEEVELQPFRTAVGAGIPMVMTAHILMPSIDTVHPATFSPQILDGILREELGFEGVVVTDDLEMAAVAERYTVEEMIDLGLETSVDIFLICHTAEKWQRAHQRLVEAGMADEQVAERIAESAGRIERLKSEFFAHRTRPWTPSEAWSDRLAGEAHHQKLQREG